MLFFLLLSSFKFPYSFPSHRRALHTTTCGLTLAGVYHKGADESKLWCYLPAVNREHTPAGAKPPVACWRYL